MKLIELLCPRCGATLKVDTSSKQAYCEHCSTIFLIDDEVKRIRVDDAEEVGYKFEKGRQRAQSEKGRSTYSEYSQKDSAARSDYRSDAYSDYKHQADPEPSSYEPPAPAEPEEKKKPAWHIVFWILGWIFIFPIPLIFLISRGKKTREGEGGRIFIVLIAIFIYMIIAYNVLDDAIPVITAPQEDYRGKTGYVTVSYLQEVNIEATDDFQNEDNWRVPTFEKDKKTWIQNGTLPHKTEVVVREQVMVRGRYGKKYPTHLLVERTDDGTQYYIELKNFTTEPYWSNQNDLWTKALHGDFIAEYKQVSEIYPVKSNGEKAEIPDGTIVLVTGINTNRAYDYYGIDAKVWYEWPEGYSGVTCCFNRDDLTLVW